MRICTYPDPVLRKSAEPILNIDEAIEALVDGMIDTMYGAPGIGLAANQVGKPIQLIVFDRWPEKEGREPFALINPEIVLTEGELVHEEACLSVIDFAAEVTRCAQVKVRGVDRNGNPVDIDADGLLARCLQHEIDHINGILFIDHISSLKRALYKKKLRKMLKNRGKG